MMPEHSAVRNIETNHLDDVVAAHLTAFPGFLMSLLGPRFLRSYYACVLDYPKRIFLGAFNADGALLGFVAGFGDPAEFYRLFGQRKTKMAGAALLHVVFRPNIWRRILGNMREVQLRSETVPGEGVTAELASLAVNPRHAGRGYGKLLAKAFVAVAWQQQSIRRVTLTTDAVDNDAANALYTKLGFTRGGTVQRTGGRLMNLYTHVLDSDFSDSGADVRNSTRGITK